mmetsp:Transcript_28729/g.80884  ORF Transcript_28729/g.80884 Transcript_28729/m.80884 type:complete len:444 (+) Transcript_28729:453-1784(+)|eukprot:CAMPEP_0117668178 /NCGR_PEP_ID=MMETSP0804-20121206/11395_1 /TAXON_ID=1074897 /ORGANISM="Tetraselmis astigmatica, Strain CCMP880" /LENGTH=443 /DNA_ID=CAMNT_0005476021 /DNA_START=374 /DNA_END=1705 /DNA_ORIENTATION=+
MHLPQQQQQQAVTFLSPEGRYTLVSERTQNGVPYSALRSTKLTFATLTSGNEHVSYLVYNVAEALIISQVHVGGKDAIRTILLGSSGKAAFPTSHSHLQTPDGYDLLIGMSSGEVLVGSLRLQLHTGMSNTKLLNAQHYNPEGVIDGSKVTQVEWSRQSEGQMFVVAHASGALYLYAKVQSQPEVDNSVLVGPAPIKTLKNSPVGNIPVNGGIIHDFSFSPDGTKLATVTGDGVMRVFEFPSGPLITGFKSYYGGLLCVAWSHDGQYIATGGEDDHVAVFGLKEQRVVVWGEGHSSWVSAVAFDPVNSDVSSPSSGQASSGPDCYRIGSVGQDAQVMFWDVIIEDDCTTPPAAESPASRSSANGHSTAEARGPGSICPSIPHREMTFMMPVMQNRWHAEPMSAILFTPGTFTTACHAGQVKSWRRPPRHSTPAAAARQEPSSR